MVSGAQETNGPADRSHPVLVDLPEQVDTTSIPRRSFRSTRSASPVSGRVRISAPLPNRSLKFQQYVPSYRSGRTLNSQPSTLNFCRTAHHWSLLTGHRFEILNLEIRPRFRFQPVRSAL